MRAGRWVRWLAAAAGLLALTLTACTVAPPEPPLVGQPRWRLTVSPQEPAADIPAEVTLQQIGLDGKRIPLGSPAPPPGIRARLEDGGSEPVRAKARAIDGRGAWLFDITFPRPGRWQVALDMSQPAGLLPGLATSPIWPPSPVAPPAILRDAYGGDDVTLALRVVPDRGPVLWWLRTHLLESIGFVVILVTSVVTYVLQQRRQRVAAGRS